MQEIPVSPTASHQPSSGCASASTWTTGGFSMMVYGSQVTTAVMSDTFQWIGRLSFRVSGHAAVRDPLVEISCESDHSSPSGSSNAISALVTTAIPWRRTVEK